MLDGAAQSCSDFCFGGFEILSGNQLISEILLLENVYINRLLLQPTTEV
jgi:hypothetical protein